MTGIINTLTCAATDVTNFCFNTSAQAGRLGCYVLSPLDNIGNHPSAAWYGLKFLIGINELINPNAFTLGRFAAVELADTIDYLSTLHLINAVLHTTPKEYVTPDKAVGAWKSLAFGIVGVSVTLFLARSLEIIDLNAASRSLSQFTIFEITPFAKLTEFGLGNVLQVSLIAAFSLALYEHIRGIEGVSTTVRVTAIVHYSSTIAARVAIFAGGALFPVSAPVLGALIILSAGSGLLKCHLNGYK